jgi:hypothetical protein
MPQLIENQRALRAGCPAVVLGYIKDFLEHLTLRADGRVTLMGRPVTGAVNDRFCLNVISRLGHQVDLTRFLTVNRCFLAGGDKGVAYDLLNDFIAESPDDLLPSRVEYQHTSSRDELIRTVLDWRSRGLRPVIKPHATGIGHGIEFFLDPEEGKSSLITRIDRSIQLTEQFYQAAGGAFPYTVCEFIDACTLPDPRHPLCGHKYELRVVVYRDGGTLRAFPSIAKIASTRYDPMRPDETSLINNITASAVREQKSGVDYMLPLCNPDTLALLDLSVADLKAVCSMATRYLRSVLDKVQDQPTRFGLPDVAAPAEQRILPVRVKRVA